MNAHLLVEILERLMHNRQDEAAWEDLYRKLWPYVMASMYRGLGGNRTLAEEAAQDVMFRILRHADINTNPLRFLAYVRSICTSVLSDQFRRLRREPLPGADPLALIPDSAPTAEEVAIRRDQIDLALSVLPDDERAVAEYLLRGLKPAEIAESMSSDVQAIYQTIERLKRSMRKQLKYKG